jgi:hypothetical protein
MRRISIQSFRGLLLIMSIAALVLLSMPLSASAAEVQASTPEITSISPDILISTTQGIEAKVYGYQFQPGAQVELAMEGEAPIPASDEEVNYDGEEITCQFGFYGAVAGAWDVRVINPDSGTAILPYGVRILDVQVEELQELSGSSRKPSIEEFEDFLYLVSNGGIRRSSDMFNWDPVFADVHGAWTLQSFDGCLYAGTYGTSLFPNPTACQIFRTSDGTSWVPVIDEGFGDYDNRGVYSLEVFQGQLYAGVLNTSQGCDIWRSPDGDNWGQVASGGFGDYRNKAIRSMEVFNGDLYVGTWNESNGCQLWRSSNGTSWVLAKGSGFGVGSEEVQSICVFKDQLYVGIEGGHLWRTSGSTWEHVVAGDLEFPNAHDFKNFSSMVVAGDLLCLYATQGEPSADVIMVSSDGQSWIPIWQGFSYWAADFLDMHVKDDYLYFGAIMSIKRISGLMGSSLPPDPQSVTPRRGYNTASIRVTITGSGFEAGAQVRLVMSGQSPIYASSVQVPSPDKITCTFDLKGATPGMWDLEVTNPDGQNGILTNAFEVIPCGIGGGMAVLALGLLLGLISAGGVINKKKKRSL